MAKHGLIDYKILGEKESQYIEVTVIIGISVL